MSDTKYNGWTNYETWRVNLEIFDGFCPQDYYSDYHNDDVVGLADSLKAYAIEVIEQGVDTQCLALDYALAFLDAVNWYEIAQAKIEEYPDEDSE